MKLLFPLLLLLNLPDGFSCPLPYCPFTREAENCDLIAFVTLENVATLEKDEVLKFKVQKMLKAPPGLESLKQLRQPYDKRMNPDANCKDYVLFGDVSPGKIEIFRQECCSPELRQYLEGLLKCKDTPAQLRCIFPYLHSSDKQVATDAGTVFDRSTEELYANRALFDPDKLRQWLSTKSPDHQNDGLCVKLLGYCGSQQDIPRLKELLNQTTAERLIISECLSAIIELSPQEGWELALKLIGNTGKDSFPRRYAVHRALCHFKEANRALPPEKTMHHILDISLTQDDFADLSIEFIRRWKMWSYSSRIIGLYKSAGPALVRRSIVRLALQSPDPACQPFIVQLRKDHPELVRDSEEILELETGDSQK